MKAKAVRCSLTKPRVKQTINSLQNKSCPNHMSNNKSAVMAFLVPSSQILER